MNGIQDIIYQYFDRNPQLRVLFIFNDDWAADELSHAKWAEGYRYVDFKGDGFTVKYNLDNDWKHDKVILMMHQESPLQRKSLQASFPLMDVLTANMEYKKQDYQAFMQQYNLPETDRQLVKFVERNMQALQSDKMHKLFAPYYADRSITTDKFQRGFISTYMGVQRILDWDAIIVRLLLQGRESERQKQTDFFIKLRSSKDASEALNKRLTDIFGVGFDDKTLEKVGNVVKVFKYNAITQNLAPASADNYKQHRITDSLALQQMNRILELALSNEKTANGIQELFDDLGADIRDENIIQWYGTEANYYFVPERLCQPIVKTLLEEKVSVEPELVISRVEDLLIKHNDHGAMAMLMDYTLLVARTYKAIMSIQTIKLNTSDEYVARYVDTYSHIDQLYRLSNECYYKLDPSLDVFATAQQQRTCWI